MRRDIAVIAGITLLVLVAVFGIGPWLSRTPQATDTREGRIIRHAPDTTPDETPVRPAPVVAVRVLDGRSGQRREGGASVILEDAAGGIVDTARGAADGLDVEFVKEIGNWPLRVEVRHAGYRQVRPVVIDAPGVVDVMLEPLHMVTLLADGQWRYVRIERIADDTGEAQSQWATWQHDGTVIELPPGRYDVLLTEEPKTPAGRMIREACATASFEVKDTAATFRLVPTVLTGEHIVRGALHDKWGLQLTGIEVCAVLLGPGSLRRVVASALADDLGAFTLTGLPEGTYRIQPANNMDPHGPGAFAHVSVPHADEVALVMDRPVSDLGFFVVYDEHVVGEMPYAGFWQTGASIYSSTADGTPVVHRHWDTPETRGWKDHFTVPRLPDAYSAIVATKDSGQRAVAVATIRSNGSGRYWRHLVAKTPEAGATIRVRGLAAGTAVELHGRIDKTSVLLAKGKAEPDGDGGIWIVDSVRPQWLRLTVRAEGYKRHTWTVNLWSGTEHEVTLVPSAAADAHDRPVGGVKIQLPAPATPTEEEPPAPPEPPPPPTYKPHPHPVDENFGPVRQVEIVISGKGDLGAQQALVHAHATEWVMTAAVDEVPRTPRRIGVRHETDTGRAILSLSNLSRNATSLTLQIPGHKDIVINLTDATRYEVSFD